MPRPLSGPRLISGATTPHAFPELLLRPADRSVKGYDITRDPSPSPEAVAHYDATAPIVGRWVSFAAQGHQETAYTLRPGRGFIGGTAPGGDFLLPPEVDLEDIE